MILFALFALLSDFITLGAVFAQSLSEIACNASIFPAVINSDSGWISSPNYPSTYVDSSDCRWLIRSTQANMALTILFHDFSTETNVDFVYIHDGDSISAPVIVRISGTQAVKLNYTTTTNSVFLRFTSDRSVIDRGFNATYWTTSPTIDTCSDACNALKRPLLNTGSSGFVTSPNYPYTYCYLSVCEWFIAAPLPNQVIRLYFNDFDMDYNDGFQLYDGQNASAPLLVSLSGGSRSLTGELYVSSQRYVYIRLTSDYISVRRGFNVSYYALSEFPDECGARRPATIFNNSGVITTPYYPDFYPNSLQCEWLLKAAQEDKAVSLYIAESSLDIFDDVRIYDGKNTTAPLLATFPGYRWYSNVQYISTGPYLYIIFSSSDRRANRGFRASYSTSSSKTPACTVEARPVVLNASSGETILSPNYPLGYYSRMQCAWLIVATNPSHVTMLYFNEFSSANPWDPLRIYDGFNSTAAVIVQLDSYDYTETPGSYMSSQRYMFITFQSDEISVTVRGFNAAFSALTGFPECLSLSRPVVYQLNSTSPVIMSPLYPYYYFNLANCAWLIVGDGTGQIIRLDFSDIQLNGGYSSGDFVNVFDGQNSTAELIVTLSYDGYSTMPGAYVTSQPLHMYIELITNWRFTRRGFNATYSAERDSTGGACLSTKPLTLTAARGIILSQNYPSNFFHVTGCEWRIIAQRTDEVVLLDAVDIYLGYGGTRVDLYDGYNKTSQLITSLRYFGSFGLYQSTQRYLYVTFSIGTDYLQPFRGFNITYTSTKIDFAGGACLASQRPLTLNGSGTIVSPNYPTLYYNKMECVWLLVAGSNQMMTIYFHFFSTWDYVNIYDGNSTAAPRIVQKYGRYDDVLGAYASSQQYMLVSFLSDDVDGERGFNATFSEQPVLAGGACMASQRPRTLNGSGTIVSPNYPSLYYNQMECAWLLVSSSNQVVTIYFHFFSTWDYVNIHDGNSTAAPRIVQKYGRYGDGLGAYASSQQYMFVSFLSNDVYGERGFNATFLALPVVSVEVCSSNGRPTTLYGSSLPNTMTSPNYPFYYFNNIDCRWLIAANNTEEVIAVSFTDVNVRDRIRIYDGKNDSSQQMVSLLGQYSSSQGYHSSQRFMYITFEQNDADTLGGFNFSYWAIKENELEACLSTRRPLELVSDSGTLTSLNSPASYFNIIECSWRLKTTNPAKVCK